MLKKSVKSNFNVDMGILIFRLVIGGLMLTHGYGKFMQLLDGNFQFADPIGIGQEASLILTVLAEFVCSILIIIGLFTRLATIPLIITMIIAAFIIHSSDPLNVKELAILYLSGYIILFYTGGGRYSVDKVIYK